MPITIYAVCVIFAFGVTVALVLQIYLGESLVKGVLVSDHELCTTLGQRVICDGGSSVDAAIAGALCLGIVHPHVSGVGGGGVMLVHNIKMNETRVIDFQGAAPQRYREEVKTNSSELKAGLQVGVPGMLLGLHRAHSLYGSLSWEDVISRAADVATEGFNVSFSLSDAISKVKGEQLSQRFRDMFVPEGQALHPGSYVRMPGLAQVLRAGLFNFYHGNLSQEMEDEVQANGGVLSRDDISNYSVEVEQPLEGLYNEFIIQVPPPSAGALLMSALNILESFHLKDNITKYQTHHLTEALKAALDVAIGLGDPKYDSSETDMLSKSQDEVLQQTMNYSHTSPSEHYSMFPSFQAELMVGQVIVIGPDNLMVSVASSLSRPFGSRILTQSGILLNSLLRDVSWPQNTRGQIHTHQRKSVATEKRPLFFLMPTMMLPAGDKHKIYMALSSSAGQIILSAISQLLNGTLLVHNVTRDSHSSPRLLIDSKFPEEIVQPLHDNSHIVQKLKTLSSVQGIRRNRNIIKAINIRQLFDNIL
ncbi:glutathione hydrolase 7-like [Parambassis ranga]|uniref:Glutathione hydrolase 7-like n=1 Tax=Parambassis ranga TaxID=210632 RepID=A0A6P7IDN4_9TELE|nr:glutathione hydrolase 7-like [Parambassis ranga]